MKQANFKSIANADFIGSTLIGSLSMIFNCNTENLSPISLMLSFYQIIN